MPSPKKVTSAKGWKKVSRNEPLTLPSGNVCLLKPPSLPELLADGLLPEGLTSIATKHIDTAKNGGKAAERAMQKAMEKSIQDRDSLAQMFTAVARITAACVVEPEVSFHQKETEKGSGVWEDIPEDDRNEDTLYTDEVDFNDQLFIFNVVMGGSRDLESFRKSTGLTMDGLAGE